MTAPSESELRVPADRRRGGGEGQCKRAPKDQERKELETVGSLLSLRKLYFYSEGRKILFRGIKIKQAGKGAKRNF